MSHPELLLQNQLCFLVHRLDRAILSRYRPLLEGLGLTYPQYLAMLALWEKEGRTVGELCEALALDTGTVSPLLKRLEATGLVERRRGKEDERSVRVALTERGRAMEEEARKIPAAVAGCLIAGAEEYASLRFILSGLLERLEKGECGELPNRG